YAAAGEACNTPEITTATCPSSQSCHVVPPSGFLPGKYCIYKRGDDYCPSGTYTERHQYSGSFSDDRGCFPCISNSTGGPSHTSGVTVTFYGAWTCTDAGATMPVPSACRPITGNPRSAKMTGSPVVTAAPSCMPLTANAIPRGSARPDDVWTLC